jgi:hypothetical protein
MNSKKEKSENMAVAPPSPCGALRMQIPVLSVCHREDCGDEWRLVEIQIPFIQAVVHVPQRHSEASALVLDSLLSLPLNPSCAVQAWDPWDRKQKLQSGQETENEK